MNIGIFTEKDHLYSLLVTVSVNAAGHNVENQTFKRLYWNKHQNTSHYNIYTNA